MFLGEAIVVVVCGGGVCQHRDEAALCVAAGAGSGGSHLDVSCHCHGALLLAVVVATGGVGVQVLIKLVPVHLAQELGLAQLVQVFQLTLLRRRGELAQVSLQPMMVDLDLGEGGAVVGEWRGVELVGHRHVVAHVGAAVVVRW